MCTAATYTTKDFYFGRTLDYEFSYGEEVVVMPRNFNLRFRHSNFIKKSCPPEVDLINQNSHYAMIGMAHLVENYPLFYEAVNEKGLGMAGLNFVGNACYSKETIEGKDNVAVFEFIPWILAQCASVKEAKVILERINLMDIPFSEELPTAQLHWMIADKEEAITVESVQQGMKIYNNPVGVMTNNPPFDKQMFQLNNYMHLSTKDPKNCFSDKLSLDRYSRGMGALGLPGDLSSQSRFVRVAFVKMNSISGDSEEESVNQFFHILGSVDQQRGCCNVGDTEAGEVEKKSFQPCLCQEQAQTVSSLRHDTRYEITIYTSCCNTGRGIYYYTTYGNHQITAIDMHKEELDQDQLICYPLVQGEQIRMQN